jgi:agmatinase
MSDQHAPPDFARQNGWDREYDVYLPPEIPAYLGPVSFCNRPLVEQAEHLFERAPDVAVFGAPFDDGVSYRPGARFGPRAIRQATYNQGGYSLQLDVEPFAVLDVVDAGDANVVPAALERGHAMVFRKTLEVASSGAVPIILGGDHSITWPAASAVAQVRAPRSIGMVHFDAHADTAHEDWGVLAGHGTPMRRLIESGAISGRNFVQVGLRGYWPPPAVFKWMQEHGLRWHFMHEIEERGTEAVIDDAISEALDGPDAIYLSIDIDVLDPGMAPGTGTPEPGGLLTRELLRAIRRIVGRVELAAMDIVEVSPPYDTAEITSMAAHRLALEAISALAVKKRDGRSVRFEQAERTVITSRRRVHASGAGG